MGQYHVICNITKREKLNPHKLGCGLKQLEQVGNFAAAGTGPAGLLFYLLSFKESRGGGDFEDGPNKGRWYGDQIAVVGDYAEAGDDDRFDSAELYDGCKDITDEVIVEWARECGVKFVGDGWCNVVEA